MVHAWRVSIPAACKAASSSGFSAPGLKITLPGEISRIASVSVDEISGET